jgi:hypothetical protein
MEKRNGNFVGEKDIPFGNDQIADILQLKCRILEMFRTRNVAVSFTQNVPSENYYDDTASDYSKLMRTELTVRFKPVASKRGLVQKGYDSCKRKVYAIDPCVHIMFHNQQGFDSVTGKEQVQPCVYVRTHGFQERGYRKHKWEGYSLKPSFGYGYEIETLWQDAVEPALERLWNDINLLIE